MFARTKRLTLRPGWPEDAAALAQAIGHEAVAMRLARVPWPYTSDHAEAFLAMPRGPHEARFLILDQVERAPRIVGGIGLTVEEGGPAIGYWLTPSVWGRGYATEAGRAVIDMARHALGIDRLRAFHHADNPASGQVLRKLGFRESGRERRYSLARGGEVEGVCCELDLAGDRTAAMPIAA